MSFCDILLESVVSTVQIMDGNKRITTEQEGKGGAGFLSERNPDLLSLGLL